MSSAVNPRMYRWRTANWGWLGLPSKYQAVEDARASQRGMRDGIQMTSVADGPDDGKAVAEARMFAGASSPGGLERVVTGDLRTAATCSVIPNSGQPSCVCACAVHPGE